MTSVEVYVHHHIPGRIRFRVPAAKGTSQRLQELSVAIAKVRGISAVEYNPVTGSILIQYSPHEYRDLHSLDNSLSASGVPIVVRQEPTVGRSSASRKWHHRRSTAAKAIDSFFTQLDDDIRTATSNEVDLKFIMPMVMAVLGLISYRRSSATPLWLTLMIFAFHSFLGLHSPAIEDIAGAEQTEMEMEA
jgi:hypothetical protein